MDVSEKEEGERSSDDESETLEVNNEHRISRFSSFNSSEKDQMGNNTGSIDTGQYNDVWELPSTSEISPREQMNKAPTKTFKKNRKRRNRGGKNVNNSPLEPSVHSHFQYQVEQTKVGSNPPFFGLGPTDSEPTRTGANRLPLGGPVRFGVRHSFNPPSMHYNPEEFPGIPTFETTPHFIDYRNRPTFFNMNFPVENINQGRFGMEEAPLDSRLSEDMDISPVDSVGPDPGPGYVLEVNSPLESENFEELQSGEINEYSYISSTMEDGQGELHQEQTSSFRNEESQPNPIYVKRKKRFSKKFLEGIRSALLDSLEESSSSDTESESELYEETQRLKNQLEYHRDELQDCLEKKAKLVKELENCELVISYHQEAIARLMKDISTKSSQAIRHLKSKTKKKNKKAERLLKEFESRVHDVLSEMADMTVPAFSKDSRQSEARIQRVQETANENNEDESPTSNTSKSQIPTSDPNNISKDSVSQNNQKENTTVSDIMMDDIERRKRKRQKLLSKEEELRQKLMKKKSTMLTTKKTSVSNNSVSEKPGIVGKTSRRLGSVLEKLQDSQNLLVSSDSTTSILSQKSSNPVTNKSLDVLTTVNGDQVTAEALNEENTFVPNDTHAIEKTLEEMRHCNSTNSLKSFMLDQTIPVKESLEKFRCRIDPSIPICYFDVYGHCIDQNCNEQHIKDSRMSDQQLLKEILSLFPDRKNSSETLETQAARLLKEKTIDEVVDNLREEAKLVLSNA